MPLLETKTRPVLGYNRKKPVLVIKKKPFLVIKKKPFLVIKKKPVLVINKNPVVLIKKNPVVLIKKNPLLVVVNEKKLNNPCSEQGKSGNTCNVNAQHITGGTFVGKRDTKEKRQWYGNTANVNSQFISGGNFFSISFTDEISTTNKLRIDICSITIPLSFFPLYLVFRQKFHLLCVEHLHYKYSRSSLVHCMGC